MFIQTEATPNPATLKFLPGCQVMPSGSADFQDAGSAGNSPLAQRLFEVDNVAGVHLGAEFVTVTKADGGDWTTMKPLILGAIMDHFSSGKPVIEGTEEEETAEDDDPTVAKIKELLDTRVRPAVAQDGGDIVFRSYEDGIVYLDLQGACSGCPGATMTLRNGVENMLKYYLPEIKEVRQANA